MTQEELAERSGLSVRGLRKLERGLVTRPHRHSLETIAAGLGLADEDRQRFIDSYRGVATAPSALESAGLHPVPRQLPPRPPHLVGRSAEVSRLDRLSTATQGPATAVIVGTAGVGKTALAAWWAHKTADLFPDGQLFVNLRGFAPAARPTSPVDVVRDFLSALDVRPDQIPDSLDAMVGLYRSIVAGRRILVVLDNARDVEQVRPLLPPAEGGFALVTSRNQLTGLVAEHGAHPIALDVLTEDAAVELLALRLGAQRAADNPDALSALSRQCARLPLALVIAAARTAVEPSAALKELGATRARLDDLSTDDPLTTMRSVFSWSHDALQHQSQRMFRDLSLHPGTEISVSAAASLTGLALSEAEDALQELSSANMVSSQGRNRYAFHDLLRDYASELVELRTSTSDRNAAVHRLLDHYVFTAAGASSVLSPHRRPVDLPPRPSDVVLGDVHDDQGAAEWLAEEHAALTPLVELAAAAHLGAHVWQLAEVFSAHLDRGGYWQEWRSILETALEATLRLGDSRAQALTYRRLGTACVRMGRFEEALRHLENAIRLCEGLGDPAETAEVHGHISYVLESTHRYAEALAHTSKALDLLRETGDRAAQSRALNSVGWHHALLGRYREALDYCEKALALATELGHVRTQAAAWDSIGYASYHLGDFDRGRDAYDGALLIWRETHARYDEGATLVCLGDLHQAAGDVHRARQTWTAALGILDDLGHADADEVRQKLAQP